MTKSARSILIFSIYMIFLGGVLVVAPNFLLTLCGFPETNELWVREAGMLVLILAYYYFLSAKHNLTVFIQATVYGRFAVLGFFIGFVLFGLAEPKVIMFGFVDAFGAIWTQLSLRSESRS